MLLLRINNPVANPATKKPLNFLLLINLSSSLSLVIFRNSFKDIVISLLFIFLIPPCLEFKFLVNTKYINQSIYQGGAFMFIAGYITCAYISAIALAMIC